MTLRWTGRRDGARAGRRGGARAEAARQATRAEARELLWRAARRRPGVLVRLFAWSLAEAAPAFLSGQALAHALDDGFAAGRPATGLAWLGLMAVAWLAAALGARQVLLAIAAIVEPFRDTLLRRVVAGTLYRTAASGMRPDSAALARLGRQVELARDSFAAVIAVSRSFLFSVTGVLVGVLTLMDAVLPLVLLPLAAGLALFSASLPAMARLQRRLILAEEGTASSVAAMVDALRDVTACGAEDRVAAAVGRDVTRQAEVAKALSRLTAARMLSLAVGGWLPILMVLVATPALVRDGATAGVILGTLTYVAQSLTPALGGLVQGVGVNGVRLVVALERILSMGPAPRQALAADGPGTPPRGALLRLRRVTFAYGPAAEPVVSDLSLVVREGDHLAVVGPSGIGKSTVAALAAGLLRPGEGQVLIGGVPVASLSGPALSAARVLIPQEAYVFRGTLGENLTYLAPGRSPSELDKAVDAVGMAELAARIGGYEALVDPSELSSGERQLIALTRAYLSPARLILLDEATCHLDPAAEARAEEAFAAREGTLIVIAHRLTSALRARRVLVMDGVRAQVGTHEEMIAASPLYRDLMGRWEDPVASGA
ncbi:ABC transporter ATP-binding protein [Sphaerisporangium krabiense]|uniref:ATP-binding cassette subfamily C protein n=1 Tax=Sphaerisporangium krabiense TaxID=763782 RepID=A0A7W9DT59_9ACTN|nr:ABC transporter ATP-binding protein [Sphaerisporangium krabiense]MBB5630291.1 ATP-binding cassette subfamily C protein [Sphaerisporangium krabiense]GII62758.1 ABC transporter ATP-binding protein [Sphaerisporangium krabiense]